MDRIYRGADLTIVAAAGDDEHFGLPGVGTTTRKKQTVVELDSCTLLTTGPDPTLETRRSRWWSRGWTFQESLLSRRRLIFTEHQSWFECSQRSWMEALELFNSPDQAPEPWASTTEGPRLTERLPLQSPFRMQMGLTEAFTRLREFSKCIREYSMRTLTFDVDSLNAFAGISRYFRNCNPPVAHILGIPFIPPTTLPMNREQAAKHMFYFLSWFHPTGTLPRRREHFPSWTWAGWAGRVDWMTQSLNLPFERDRSFQQIMRHIQFEVDGNVIPEEDYLTVFDADRFTFSSFEVTLCFQAQIVPSSLFSRDTKVEPKDQFQDDYPSNENLATETSGNSHAEESNEESQKSSKSVPAIPNDWGNWTVGNHELWDRSLPPDCDPPDFIDHLEDGHWTCLLLGDYDEGSFGAPLRFLLVVEWLDDYTARRVGSVVLDSPLYPDRELGYFFDNSELSWKSVRII